MSGGSWDYLCWKMEDAADSLTHSGNPLRRAFGKKMKLYADAMHDIEWVDSGDFGEGDDEAAIKKALGESANELVMTELIEEANEVIDKLEKYMDDE